MEILYAIQLISGVFEHSMHVCVKFMLWKMRCYTLLSMGRTNHKINFLCTLSHVEMFKRTCYVVYVVCLVTGIVSRTDITGSCGGHIAEYGMDIISVVLEKHKEDAQSEQE